jgi:hypothetical protein
MLELFVTTAVKSLKSYILNDSREQQVTRPWMVKAVVGLLPTFPDRRYIYGCTGVEQYNGNITDIVHISLLIQCWTTFCLQYSRSRVDGWICEIITHSLMELSPSWEAANCTGTQEIISILWNPKVHYRLQKSPPLAPILGQINPIHPISP